MDNTRQTEIARRWLLTDRDSATYRYWRDVTREIVAETKGLGAHPGWTRREAAVLLLADELQTGVAGDSWCRTWACTRNLSAQRSMTSIGGRLPKR